MAYDPLLTAADIRRLLTELGDRLASEAREGEILVAGGALLIAANDLPRRSEDIDALYLREAPAIARLARAMASDLGLDPGWLNQGFSRYLRPDAPRVPEPLLRVPGLIVWAVTLEHMFFLKCTGHDFDAPDLRFIAGRLGGVDFLRALEIYEREAGHPVPTAIERWLEDLL